MDDNSDNKIAKNYLYNLVYQLVAMIIPFVTTPYVSRILGAEGIGEYSFAFSCVTIFSILGNFGFSTYGQLTIAGCRKNSVEKSKNLCGIFSARLILMLFSTGLYFVYIFVTNSQSTIYYILLIHMIASALDISWFYQGVEDFKIIAIINTLTKVIGTVLVFSFVKTYHHVGLYTVIISGTLLFSNIVYFVFLYKHDVHLDPCGMNLSKHLKASIVYFIPTIATSVYTVMDKSMIGWITGSDYENGVYEQAQKIVHMSTTVVTSISTVILPRMAALFKENDMNSIKRLFCKFSHIILWMAFPIAFGLFGLAKSIVPLYLGNGYDKCIILLMILSPLIIIIGLNNAIGQQILIATRKQNEYNRGVIAGSLANLILNFIFIRIWQSIGAAVASVISELLILSLFIFFSTQIVSFRDVLYGSWKTIIASVSMLILLSVLSNIISNTWVSFFLIVCLGFACYVMVLLILQDQITINFINKVFKIIRRKNFRDSN